MGAKDVVEKMVRKWDVVNYVVILKGMATSYHNIRNV